MSQQSTGHQSLCSIIQQGSLRTNWHFSKSTLPCLHPGDREELTFQDDCDGVGSEALASGTQGVVFSAVDRRAGLTGVTPGLPQGAAAGGAADAYPDLRVARQAPVSSRSELQVAVAHTVVCRAIEQPESPLARERTPGVDSSHSEDDNPSRSKVHSTPGHQTISGCRPLQDHVVGRARLSSA